MKDTDHMYLCLSQEKIIQFQVRVCVCKCCKFVVMCYMFVVIYVVITDTDHPPMAAIYVHCVPAIVARSVCDNHSARCLCKH